VANITISLRGNNEELGAPSDILVITVWTVLCGLERWTPFEAFGKADEARLRTSLDLPNGIPCFLYGAFPEQESHANSPRIGRTSPGLLLDAEGLDRTGRPDLEPLPVYAKP